MITFEETTDVASKPEDDEFDMFAQSRGSTFESSRYAGSTYDDNRENVPQDSFAAVINARGPYPKSAEQPRNEVF